MCSDRLRCLRAGDRLLADELVEGGEDEGAQTGHGVRRAPHPAAAVAGLRALVLSALDRGELDQLVGEQPVASWLEGADDGLRIPTYGSRTLSAGRTWP